MRAFIFCLLLAYAAADPLFSKPAQEEFSDLEEDTFDARIFTSSEYEIKRHLFGYELKDDLEKGLLIDSRLQKFSNFSQGKSEIGF